MDGLTSMFHTVGGRRLISTEGAFARPLLDEGRAGGEGGSGHHAYAEE